MFYDSSEKTQQNNLQENGILAKYVVTAILESYSRS